MAGALLTCDVGRHDLEISLWYSHSVALVAADARAVIELAAPTGKDALTEGFARGVRLGDGLLARFEGSTLLVALRLRRGGSRGKGG